MISIIDFEKWFDVPVLEIDLTRMPNLNTAVKLRLYRMIRNGRLGV